MEFDYNKLKDPAFFAENRVPAHSDHAVYADQAEKAAGVSSLRHSLNGTWKFFCARNEGQVIPGFEAAGYDCNGWEDIAVPAHIQLEGHGKPQYVNVQYPWDGHEEVEIGQIPTRFDPVACYVKYFYLPEAMLGRRVFVSFQGAESCVAVWLNGHYVGYGSDSFTPSEFELTDYLTDGENKLACRVYRWTAGSWLEDQDFFRFSGLFRDVYLYALPEVHVRDVRVRTALDDEYKDAVLDAAVQVQAASNWTVRLTLKDGETVVASAEQSGDGDSAAFNIPVRAPEKWSAERPYLYELEIEACAADGAVAEVAALKVGFRRFELKGGVMCLNGQRIVFKGTNRHDFCAETGRAITVGKIRRDLVTMKRNNINAIRTSHYPNHSALYALCDELGLYVIDENNMESHGAWDPVARRVQPIEYALPGDREDWQPMLLDRVNSTYQRDKNHPCVLIWSCGNESFGGSVIYEMSQLFRKLDDTRLVHYEGVFLDPRRPETTDIESRMYTPADEVRAFLAQHRGKPFIMCEYTHAMGNSNGAMHKYTELAYEEPLYQGGFIWDFIDQAVRRKDRYGNVAYGYGGDFDDRPNDGDFSGNGITYADGGVSPKMQEVKYNYQNIVAYVDTDENSVRVVNRHLFTGTAAYECVVTLARDGVQIKKAALDTDVPPLSEREYTLPFEKQTVGGEYAVTVSFRLREDTAWAGRGHEIAFGQGIYRVEKRHEKIARRPLRVVRGNSNLGVQGDGFEVLFSYMTGGLTSYKFGGAEMLKAMPMPNFWRAPTDNDRGNFMPQRCGQWKLASLYASAHGDGQFFGHEPPKVTEEDGAVRVGFTYYLPTTPKAKCAVTYTVRPCGTVETHLHYDPVEGLPDMPEFGMLFKLDADYDHVRWYGLGPEETYADRCRGAKLGIWESAVADRMAKYLLPQECGNSVGVRWAEVTDYKGRGLRFMGEGMSFSALPYTPHEIENAAHGYELPPVHYTVVRAALAQLGVGGDNSWGAPVHGEFHIDGTKPIDFVCKFRGIG